MKSEKILDITIPTDSKKDILEQIKKNLNRPNKFFHIVSLNPENLVIARNNTQFKKIIETAQFTIIDGIGIILASQLLGIPVGERYPGVDLMSDLIQQAQERRLTVLLIGGKPNLALNLSKCYQQTYPEAKFFGVEGIKNIQNPTKNEEKTLFSIVADYKPHLIFVAFGSPDQELWIERHRDQFKNCVVMGVGGAFDYLSGRITRAPALIQKIGLEWLYRLIRQPWRFKRQLRLLEFCWLVLKQRIINC